MESQQNQSSIGAARQLPYLASNESTPIWQKPSLESAPGESGAIEDRREDPSNIAQAVNQPMSTDTRAQKLKAQDLLALRSKTFDGEKSGRLINHWRGDCSLSRAYWINFSLIANCIAPFFLIFAVLMTQNVAIAYVAYSLLGAVWIWGTVGLWRSASKSPERGGSKFWAWICKVIAIFSGVYSFFSLISVLLI